MQNKLNISKLLGDSSMYISVIASCEQIVHLSRRPSFRHVLHGVNSIQLTYLFGTRWHRFACLWVRVQRVGLNVRTD